MIILHEIILMLGLLACSQNLIKQQNQDFEVLQATSQEWVAGARGGGRGINYQITIKIKTNKPLNFNSIWVAGKKLNIKPKKGGQYDELKLATNDVVTLIASDYMINPGNNGRKEEEKVNNSPEDSAKAPIEYEGAALMQYMVDGSAKYFALSQIKVLPPIYGH